MLKNKLKKIAILMILILTITIPIVIADNETEQDVTTVENVVPDDAQENNSTNVTPENDFKKGDVYLIDNDVVIDYIVDGNLFIIANSVTINSQIGGDAFILAKNVTIGEEGYIFSNLFVSSQNVTINGVVYDLYGTSNITTINGYVYRDLRTSSNTINIFGTIGRNVFANCSNINLATAGDSETTEVTKGVITGNLEYSSNKEATIPEGVVGGEITFNNESNFNNIILEIIIALIIFVVTVVIIWLVCLWITPKILNKTELLTSKKILPVIGFGILTPIVITILSILLFILGITSKIALLLLGILFFLVAISTSIFVINLNKIICDKLKITKKWATFGMLILSSIVLWLICLIPIVGNIISLAAIILGLGIIVYSIIKKDSDK